MWVRNPPPALGFVEWEEISDWKRLGLRFGLGLGLWTTLAICPTPNLNPNLLLSFNLCFLIGDRPDGVADASDPPKVWALVQVQVGILGNDQ